MTTKEWKVESYSIYLIDSTEQHIEIERVFMRDARVRVRTLAITSTTIERIKGCIKSALCDGWRKRLFMTAETLRVGDANGEDCFFVDISFHNGVLFAEINDV